MSVDLLSNMLSSIKNASMAGRRSIEVPHSKESEEVAKNLQKSGFLENVKVFKESGTAGKKIHLDLSYENGLPRVTDVKRISKPGRRVYKSYKDIERVAGGYGTLVVSTSRGIMEGSEAKKRKLGGELICSVK
ncbi:MAG: Ribosomal protein S8 [candidate division WWE3 bacterium GW2011_GWC1_41_7]|uniref:Small ribosomal subunit protein uS8 n=4 Tax=Katanobacteria TaxID=422282 RepID=A0A0G0XBD5_UNCKA|nr:MAG: 30S ribosomal protein S8 [candidate division WWE3 bacterium GW2011_GWB1_41_6]KKS21478.1 MAG: Ribosomal protein S8 [candidate division WWE3 bacterium GW2011_GWC1_41_7]KKS22269.1 MAG: 30S ribosomal protein S8 [candidate division WWE3 bacterium GW2011_GWA1_41_8]OGC56621.1 MAG: 30S ribosomal protein S8 [candidate division WWE3 bacterium RIFCSPLOWO2_01_FULL_41_9]